MAEKEVSTTASRAMALPRIEIPEKFEIGTWGECLFKIETAAGVISVDGYAWPEDCYESAHGKFICKGRFSAFEAAGLIQPSWRPGIPGNAKAIQNVMLQDGFLIPIIGQKGKRESRPHIKIAKLSAVSCEVCIPVAEDQVGFLLRVRENAKAKRNTEVAEPKRERGEIYQSLEAWKEYVLRHACIFFTLTMEDCVGDFERNAYGDTTIKFNETALEKMRVAFAHIKQIISDGEAIWVNRAHSVSYERKGNVTYLRRQDVPEI